MRVLYLSNSGQIGGGNTSLLTLWSVLRPAGITPIVACPFDGPMVDACRAEGFETHVLPYHQPGWRTPINTFKADRRWSRLLRDERIDLVHANDPSGARSIAFAATRRHIPIVSHVQFPPAAGYMDWAFRFAPAPDVFIFCSQATLDGVAEEFARACPRAARVVIHNAVSTETFRPIEPRRTTVPPRIGIIANLMPVKGHLDFLDMARQITDAAIDCEFVIIGEDIHGIGYRDLLERRTRELGLQDRVEFLGHRSDVSDLIQTLDLLVCASHEEPFGICLIEAMACERPVVGTRVGGIPEVIEDGVCGFVVPARQPSQLAQAVRRLVEDDALRAKMGTAARERVLRNFSRQTQAGRIVQTYAGLMRPHPASSWLDHIAESLLYAGAPLAIEKR